MEAGEERKQRITGCKKQRNGDIKPAEASSPASSLDEEIGMLRQIIRRVAKLADDGLELAELMGMLDTVGMASTRLATLLKARRALGEADALGASIDQALAQVIRELRGEG